MIDRIIRCDACGGTRFNPCVCPAQDTPDLGGFEVITTEGERGTLEPSGRVVRTADGRRLRVRGFFVPSGDGIAYHTGNRRLWSPVDPFVPIPRPDFSVPVLPMIGGGR